MNVKNLVLGIGIFIVFMFLLHNGIRAFYSVPVYEDFCNSSIYNYYPEKTIPITSSCNYTDEFRKQEQSCFDSRGQPIYLYNSAGCAFGIKECNYCQKFYDEARTAYDKHVFVISLIIGMIVLLLGYFIFSLEPVGSALMASGIGAIVYGTTNNWGNLGNVGRFLLLLIAFVILILIAYRLNKLRPINEKKR